MSQSERHARISGLLNAGRCLQPAELMRELEVSPATLKRDIRYLRDRMNAPIDWCADRGGWFLNRARAVVGAQYELPNHWFSAGEIHALLMMRHLLSSLDLSGVLGERMAPLKDRLARMLDGEAPPDAEISRRIRVHTVGARRVRLAHFQSLGSALLRRKRAVIRYHSRGRGDDSQREVSPQRLVLYRDNWYLDAWCHLRAELRSFSVERINAIGVVDRRSIDVPDAELDRALGSGYGIFAGAPVRWARLRFSAERARWVAEETWHRDQRGSFDADGRWVLELPYADPTELAMDVMRHLPDVEVLEPAELSQEVGRRVREAARRWAAQAME